MTKANFTCPFCKAKEKIEIPAGRCLVFHKCASCRKLIKPLKFCCILCEYSDKKCHVSTKR